MPEHEDHPDLPTLTEQGAVVAYFGYGSLVNKATLRTTFLAVRRAEVVGWRRFWLPRPGGIALLSVRPDPGHPTQGVVVYDHGQNLPAVDAREAGYIRRTVDNPAIEAAPAAAATVHIYEAIRPERDAADTGARILQSYLDAVLQGFLSLYGPAGVERFVAETDGFETEILADRHAPRYPRAVVLSKGEAGFFDGLVVARGAVLRPAD